MDSTSYWHRTNAARLTRRRFITGLTAGAAGLALASACGESTSPTPQASPPGSEPGQYGGKYVFSVPGDWGGLDPATSVGFATYVFPLMYNALFDRSRLDASFYYHDLAESIEHPDEETYLFSIRPNVKIAPNTLGVPERPLDAFDAKGWMERARDDGKAALHGFVKQWVASFDAPSMRAFVVKTNGPYAYFPFRIGAPLGGTIAPREVQADPESLAAGGVGAGPFVLVPDSYTETGGLNLEKNVNYYRKNAGRDPLPYLDEVEAVRFDDRFPRRVAFVDRQIHSYDAKGRAEVQELQSQIPGVQVVEDPVNTFVSFVMNPTRPPWNDERVRLAALHALNRQQFVDLIVGPDGGHINGLVHWPLSNFALPSDELAELQPYDPARSRELLREATGDNRIEIDVIFPVTDDEYLDQHVPIFIQQMGDAGFDIKQQALDIGTWISRYESINYDSSLSLNQVYETAETALDFHAADGPLGGKNFAVGIGALYPEVEAAIQASKKATDPAAHAQAVQDCQRLIYSKGPASLPIMSWVNFTLYHEFVRNVPRGLGATGLYLTNEMWLNGASAST